MATRLYILHLACGTALPVFGAVLMSLPLVALIGLATESPRLGRVEDVIGIFVLPALFALALGFVVNRRWGNQWAVFVWVFPLAIFVHEIAIWKVYAPGKTYWQDVWDNFFGSNCSKSECLGEALVTAPCLSSIAYSIAAFLAIHVRPLQRSGSESPVRRVAH